MSAKLSETEAYEWLNSIRAHMEAHRHGWPEWTYSSVWELTRFLEALACPQMEADARARMGIWHCPDCGSIGYKASHICDEGS